MILRGQTRYRSWLPTLALTWLLTARSATVISAASHPPSFLYSCAANSTSFPIGISLQQLSFDANRILSGTIRKVATLDTDSNPSNTAFCSPITHFFNAGTGDDYLFLSMPPVSAANVLRVDITNNIPGFTGGLSLMATAAGGASGIIVDGSDPGNQASSIYFTSLSRSVAGCTISAGTPAGDVANPTNTGIGNVDNAICAYKLTQNGLQ